MNNNLPLFEFLKYTSPVIQLVWWLGIFILVLITISIFFLKYLRNYLRSNEKIEAEYKEKYETCLVTYLYSGDDDKNLSSEQQLILNELKEHVSDSFKRKILLATLLKLRSEISGETAESIDALYLKLGLLRYTLAKLKNKNWDVIAIGIRELTQFKIKRVHKIIMNNINHPMKEVRKEMELYLVHLYAFKGLEFLNVLETPISEWDQIQLLEILQLNKDSQVTDITPWLKSSNDSVVIFALKLAKVYTQFEAKEELIKLLNHKNKEIRINTISVLSHMNILEAKNILKNNFNERSSEEQIAFLKMMENIYEKSDKPFLLEHVHHENYEIMLLVMGILKNINFEEYVVNDSKLNKLLTA